jgi:hypothetical protein
MKNKEIIKKLILSGSTPALRTELKKNSQFIDGTTFEGTIFEAGSNDKGLFLPHECYCFIENDLRLDGLNTQDIARKYFSKFWIVGEYAQFLKDSIKDERFKYEKIEKCQIESRLTKIQKIDGKLI